MKQFGISGDLTPFEPANPALDIPEGDTLENKKVTNQSMNAWYGELASAIQNSGQTLTPVNGSSPNPSQLWQAISSNSFNGNLFIDAGGSTAQVRNLKAANPNTYLPPAIGGNPASPETKLQWAGFCFTMENAQNAAYDTPVTINFKDKTGVTVMTTNYGQPLAQLLGVFGGSYQDCFISNDVHHEVQPRYSYPPFTRRFDSNYQTTEVNNYRPVGQNLTFQTGRITTETSSTTAYNRVFFQVPMTVLHGVFVSKISVISDGAIPLDLQGSNIRFSDFALNNGNYFDYIAFTPQNTRSSNAQFHWLAYGYS